MNIQSLRHTYAVACDKLFEAQREVDRARAELDKALVEASSHRVGTIITITGGKKFRIDRVVSNAGRVMGWGARELSTGGWAKRSTSIRLGSE